MNSNTPNLFILGAAKSGTTTLADILRQYPYLFIPLIKEPTFFSSDVNYSNGLDWYINNFYTTTGSHLYRCDASPSYLYFGEKVVERILKDLPDQNIKFIVIFRNPVDRAYSHYWHNVNRGLRENLTFEEALEIEAQRLKTQDKELNDLGRIRYAYFNAGLYAKQLNIFLTSFPQENFLLLLQDDLNTTRFHTTVGLIQDFLQIPSVDIKYLHSNYSYKPVRRSFDKMVRKRSPIKDVLKRIIPADKRTVIKNSLLKVNIAADKYPPMDPVTRKLLAETFTPSILEFQTIIKRGLSAWLNE
jgi:hypothetical protein